MKQWLLDILCDGEQVRAVRTIHRVSLDSWLQGWLVPFIVVVLLGLCVVQYRRWVGLSGLERRCLVACRFVAYCAALFVLARPVLRVDADGQPSGPVPVVLDGSQSMEIVDAAGRTRTEASRRFALEMLALQSDMPDLQLAAYHATSEFGLLDPAAATPGDTDSTSLNRMLDQAMRGHLGAYCSGVVLFTDGAHNTSEAAEAAFARLRRDGVPLYAVGVGEETSKDVAVTFLLAEEVVFKDEKAKMYVNLSHRGYSGRQAALTVFLNDQDVASETVLFSDDSELSVPVEYVPEQTGEFLLKVEIAPAEGEITAENNAYQKKVRVIDEKVDVLMVFGAPTWEYRYVRGSLERDNRVRTRVYLEALDRRIQRRAKSGEYVTRLPDSPEQLNEEYDLVILSAVNALSLPGSFLESLSEFVAEHAGGAVFMSDARFIPYTLKGTALEAVLPVSIGDSDLPSYRDELFAARADPLTLRLTEEGQSSPLLAFSGSVADNREVWNKFPPLYRTFSGGRLKPAAVSLLEAFDERHRQSYPCIVLQSFGKGSALFMGFDSTWRWRREYGDRYFREYWGKVIQFLGLPHLLDEAAQTTLFVSRETAVVGQRVSINAKISNPDYSPYISEAVPLAIQRGEESSSLDLVPIPDRLGVYRANFWPEEPGDYTLLLPKELHARPAKLHVVRRQREFVDSGMDRALLEAGATTTGGAFHRLAEVTPQALLEQIRASRPSTALNIRESLWDSWAALLVFLLAFGVEWLLRRLFHLD